MLSLGVYVRIRKSLEPYLLDISCKYFKSGSPSINKVSEDASNLKSLELYPILKSAKIKKKITSFGFFKILF